MNEHAQNFNNQNKCQDHMFTNRDVGSKPVQPMDMFSGCIHIAVNLIVRVPCHSELQGQVYGEEVRLKLPKQNSAA